MSSRNFRKLCGNSLPAPDSDDSDGNYDPMANRHNPKSTYAGLELSSDSEPEKEPVKEESEEEVASTAHGGARKKKPQKKKGRAKKASEMVAHASSILCSGDGKELDEIDKSILEVNALLGAPPPAPAKPTASTDAEEIKSVLAVQAKYLNVANELKRLFGPYYPEEVRQRNKMQPHRNRVLKRVMVCPNNETLIYNFRKTGLSMSIEKREGDVTHFVYVHDQEHQKMHHAFLQRYFKHFRTQGTPLFSLEDAKKYMHVEPLLEISDSLFRMDETSLANEIVENVVTYLQYVAHPSFNLASMNVRLLYNYLENRPFHVVMLKYMYLLSNKACHRTALEIAKMLLNIDPSDPLAVLFIIDTLALRAREHHWLIEAIEYFNVQRQAKMLFNIQYSYALAHFHVAWKNKQNDFTEADKHLQSAIMSYPQVVLKVLEYASINESRIQTHGLFTSEPISVASEGLGELIMIYARLTWPRWREPHVMEWFLKNAIEVTENYNNSDDVKVRTKELTMLRHSIFQVWPSEILRHISIIKSMAYLVLETTLSVSNQPTSSWDPLFDRGINRYSYRGLADPASNLSPEGRALLYRFFTSIMPSTEFERPVDD